RQAPRRQDVAASTRPAGRRRSGAYRGRRSSPPETSANSTEPRGWSNHPLMADGKKSATPTARRRTPIRISAPPPRPRRFGEARPTMQIFLTGATGYIGSSVLETFLRAGHDVTALVRDPEKAELIARRGVNAVIGDLGKPAAYAAAAERADVIVHTALDGS